MPQKNVADEIRRGYAGNPDRPVHSREFKTASAAYNYIIRIKRKLPKWEVSCHRYRGDDGETSYIVLCREEPARSSE